MDLLLKEDALNKNSVFYFTGIKCKNGHIDKRYTNTDICYACKREINKRNRKNNPEAQQRRARSSYLNNKESINRSSQLWSEKNRDKSNCIKKRHRENNKEKYLKYAREYQAIKRKNPAFRICRAISKQIWNIIKGKKGWSSWRFFVEYSENELINHLKSKFTPEMSMDNYGIYWSIDHVKPVSWFLKEINEKKISDEEMLKIVKEIWALDNLQPLPCKDNSSKGNRFIG